MDSKLSDVRFTRYDLFVVVSFTGIVSYLVYALLAGAKAFDWLIMNNYGGWQFGIIFSIWFSCRTQNMCMQILPVYGGRFHR